MFQNGFGTLRAKCIMPDDLGRKGEELALRFLKEKGFILIQRNFKTPRWGEIDLVMRDGDTTVFVEVKARSGASARLYGGPLSSINYFKLRALKRAAQFYISSKKVFQEAARIDAVSVVFEDDGATKVEHFPNITR